MKQFSNQRKFCKTQWKTMLLFKTTIWVTKMNLCRFFLQTLSQKIDYQCHFQNSNTRAKIQIAEISVSWVLHFCYTVDLSPVLPFLSKYLLILILRSFNFPGKVVTWIADIWLLKSFFRRNSLTIIGFGKWFIQLLSPILPLKINPRCQGGFSILLRAPVTDWQPFQNTRK